MIGARLRRAGVLGINRRNHEYTLRWNRRSLYPRVDDKLRTKELCLQLGIPVPRLLAVARHHFELRELLPQLAKHDSFVLKPAHGAMGNGIVVVLRRDGERFLRTGGRWVDGRDLLYHGAGIISGLYALAGQPDVAMVEERLELHPALAAISVEGVPDVRVIVYRGFPVMSMIRLPTLRSAGRANLHQGAVGAGIDLVTGRTVHAVLRNVSILKHPDTDGEVVGTEIPGFARILEIAVRAADASELGYVGADVVVDAQRGPVILELNARPGLAIQLANRAGLLPRLHEVDASWRKGLAVEERLVLGRRIAARHPGGVA